MDIQQTSEVATRAIVEEFDKIAQRRQERREKLEEKQRRKGEREESHGLTGCGICVSRAAYFLERGGTFDELEAKIKKNHPGIKNTRRYTQRFIRFVTGWNQWDDWIVAHEDRMWKTRTPNLWKNYDGCKQLEEQGISPMKMFEDRVDQGKRIFKIINSKDLTEKEQEAIRDGMLYLKLVGVKDKDF